MKRVRIGKTIAFTWTVTTNGLSTSLEDADLTIEVLGPNMFYKKLDTTDYTISGDNKNVIQAVLQGKYITETGVYKLVLWENKGSDNQSVVDTDAVMIVGSTSEERQ